jgi:alpha-tubulin suppressor-like RCC1 family protein
MATTKGAWKLQEVREQILNSQWVVYNPINDPGALWGWGYNSSGQIGTNNTINRSSPVQIPGQWVANPTVSNSYGSFRKTDNTLWVWGSNSVGQLGLNNTINRSSPVQIPGSWREAKIAGGLGAGIKTDGTLWTWGYNINGALGQNDTIHRSSPVQVPGNWITVTPSSDKTIAIKCDSTAWAWGRNFAQFSPCGFLGDGTTIDRSSPVQIPGSDWVQVVVGSGNYTSGSGRRADGSAWAWGGNFYGQQGTGDRTQRQTPIQLPGATTWVDFDTRENHGMGRKSDGTLWSWGYHLQGQTGLNCPGTQPIASQVATCTPTQIPGTTWAGFIGRNPSGATKTDGTLWTWGSNASGNLGDNTRINRSSPIQVPGTNWVAYFGRSKALKSIP